MIKQSTILREECLDLKKQTEELKGNENSTRRKGSSDKTLLWVSIGVSVALILAFAIPKS
jgi:phage terminase Nu1 subunit (DNA packaging protein)